MKKLLYSISVLFCLSILISSCSKEESESVAETSTLVEARIEYQGSPAVDGCGYVLIVGSETYHPLNLGETFYVDGIDVLVDFTNTNNRGPFCWGMLLAVEITSIELI